jgi:hypothetical protein
MQASAVNDGRIQSETVNELFEQVAKLEIRIFGGQLPSDRLIPPDSLKQILRRAGANYIAAGLSGKSAAQRLELSSEVKRVIESTPETIQPNRLLSKRHAALLQIVEYLFRYLEYTADLDPDAYAAIQYLQVGLAQILIADPGALNRAEHPARRFLELLVSTCKGYDRYAGPKAEALLVQIGRLVKTAVESPDPPDGAFGWAQHEFAALLDEYDREALKLAKNVIAKEKGEVMSNDAKLAVNREIITAVEGKKLPLVLLQFLQRIWNKYLYVTYLRHGMESGEWRRGVEDIHTLIHSLRIRDRNELFRFYTGDQAPALARVRVGASRIHDDEALTKEFFATLESIHKQVADGELPVVKEITVSGPDDFSDASKTAVADAIRHMPLDDMRVGHWYKLLENGLEVRCKLIEKNLHHGYCLFSNYSGIKTARRDSTDVVQSAQAGTLKQIDSSPIFGKALTFACRQIAEQIPKLESKAQSVEQKRAKNLKRKRQAEAAEKLSRLEDERLREEARLLEESRIREREQALQQVLPSVNRMQPGGWVELIGDDGRKIACKLGLKLKSSRKLIFVDRLGRKVQELLPEHLAERIVEGSAVITDYGVAFDDTLQRLIIDRSEQVHAEQPR